MEDLQISSKVNVILNFILLFLILLTLRIWYLCIIQHDDYLNRAIQPQKRTVIERAHRGDISDRFMQPLARNVIQYNAAVSYAQIKEVPSIAWEQDVSGKRVKRYKRKEHVEKLSKILAANLELDALRIEDLIYSQAAIFPQVPYVIQEDISEKQYYRLKMLESKYLGICAEKVPKRTYPRGRVASGVVGYIGAISQTEYTKIAREIAILKQFLEGKEEFFSTSFLPEGVSTYEEAKKRLQDLKAKAYQINDDIGKQGVEASFDATLRGFHGKRVYESDAKGNFLRELAESRNPVSGQHLVLSISSELQEFAEKLLIENENIRQGSSYGIDSNHQAFSQLKQPFIKGGAIVALDPNNGDVLALASYPRFDSNDFISARNPLLKQKYFPKVNRWLENDAYFAGAWDERWPLQREIINDEKEICEEATLLTWKQYLSIILPKNSQLKLKLMQMKLKDSVYLQRHFNKLLKRSSLKPKVLIDYLYSSPLHKMLGKQVSKGSLLDEEKDSEYLSDRRVLDRYLKGIQSNYEKLLLLDLSKILVNVDCFSDPLLEKMGQISLNKFKSLQGAHTHIRDIVKQMTKDLHNELCFKPWRKKNQKEFLQEKRLGEKSRKIYARPYLTYLDQEREKMFEVFWKQYSSYFTALFLKGRGINPQEENETLHCFAGFFRTWHREIKLGAHKHVPWYGAYKMLQKYLASLDSSLMESCLRMMRSYRDLNRPLYGTYPFLRQKSGVYLEKHLASAFCPVYGWGYSRSFAYRQAATQGSIFKLVTAYAALQSAQEQSTQSSKLPLNLFSMIDRYHRQASGSKSWNVGQFMSGQGIPRFYKGGRLPKSQRKNIGVIDLIRAMEVSSNPYFSLLAADHILDPEDLNHYAAMLGYGSPTGVDLPGEISGSLPKDLSSNRTGLYSYAIGQHTLVVTPIQTAVMLATFANGGKVLKPKIIHRLQGKLPVWKVNEIFQKTTFSYQEALASIGIHFPLFVAAQEPEVQDVLFKEPSSCKRVVPLDPHVRATLFEGLRRVVSNSGGCARQEAIRRYFDHPDMLKNYQRIKPYIIGKTSTSESLERVDLAQKPNMYSHIWFGSIAFEKAMKNCHSFLSKKDSSYCTSQEPPSDIVVVVYLPYGDYGREAAPLATEIIKKWREIKKKSRH